MVVSIIEPLTENATRTEWSIRFRSIIIPTVPLQIPCSNKELLRHMTRAPGCNLTEEGRLVLLLKELSENEESYDVEFTESTACDIKNFSSGTGNMLQIIRLICWAFSLKPTILVVLIAGRDKNSECFWLNICHISVDINTNSNFL